MARLLRNITVLSVVLQLLLANHYVLAQRNQDPPPPEALPVELRPPHPPEKTEQRFTIDAKRRSEDIYSDDALPRSREFNRIDSSYYVG